MNTMTKHTLVQLRIHVAKMLNRDSVEEDVPLGMLGVDSFNVVELFLIIEELYPHCEENELADLDELTTLSEIDDRLRDAT